MMKTSAEELRRNLAEVLSRVAFGRDRVLVTRNNRVVAAIVTPEDLARLEAIEEDIEDRYDRELVARIKADPEQRRTRPWDEVKETLRDHGARRARGKKTPTGRSGASQAKRRHAR